MSDNCFKKNELFIPGTRHDERMLAALSPSYVLPDERSVADLLVFIGGYAKLINYYKIPEAGQSGYAIDGDWTPLILSDEAFNYAGISVTEQALPNITFYKYANLYESGSTTALRNEAYRVLWDILFSLYRNIDGFLSSVPVYMPLRTALHTEIKNNLVSDFRQAAAAYLKAGTFIPSANLYQPTPATEDEFKFSYGQSVLAGTFDNVWIDADSYPLAATWSAYKATLAADTLQDATSFYGQGLSNQQDRVDYSIIQLKQIFKRAFEAYARIIATAGAYLQQSLEHQSAHFGHHGLLLAFVKMFGLLQEDMNGFTRKHLEYYYNRVLQIQPAPATPDSAHIVFEAARNVSTHLVPAGTELQGGKDATGKALLYKTDNDVTISQAQVTGLKAVHLEPMGNSGAVKRFYAAPVVNSADGQGASFTGADTSWKAFGNNLSDAVLGFCIASPALHLTEGVRTIDFVFKTNDAGYARAALLDATAVMRHLKLHYSGEKQWEEVIYNENGVTENCTLTFLRNAANRTFTIRIVLPLHYKPMVGYDAKVCDGGLDTIYPVMKFVLVQGEANDGAFEKMKDISLSRITVVTDVNQLANFSLANEFGEVDSSKPVQLFGPVPKIGSPFYIGHAELAHKMVSSVRLSLNWLNYTNLATHYAYRREHATTTTNYIGISSNADFRVSVDLLRNKSWKSLNSSASFINNASVSINPAVSNLAKALDTPDSYSAGSEAYTAQSQNGFVRLVLRAPVLGFGNGVWPQLFAQQTVAFNARHTLNTIPNQPYVPVLESLQLGYTASQDIYLDGQYKKEQGQFFHLLPFGVQETASDTELLPDMDVANKELESALYIGIADVTPTQNISLLIQANEGSEDISVDPPAVSWWYLSATGWKDLAHYLVADTTGNLLKSGIITVTIPNDIDTATTRFPAGQAWIMAGIETGSRGLPHLLSVQTNAVKATFADKGNDPARLGTALGAGKIAKLAGSDNAIKKVMQPYASYGGKKVEDGAAFYTRSAERLRHKRRAITIWDHERLVLNEFPEVYMSKCLNHTGYALDCDVPAGNPGRMKYKENLPGHVMLVTVPFITNLQAGNIYQPTLSASKLADIKNFIHGMDNEGSCNQHIKPLHCGHVALHVVNPQYETIEVQCKVKIKDCLDQLAYRSQLGFDLHTFLSPWIDGNAGSIRFGGKLHASQVVHFIEQRTYVDYLEDLRIVHRVDGVQLNAGDDASAVASTSRSVLTSVGNDENGIPKHNITLV